MKLSAGDKLGPYEILVAIGSGGMGEVYKARDSRLGRSVAIKVLPEAFPSNATRERFQREARSASSLNHPNICAVYDVGEERRHPFIVMELLDGTDLREKIGGRPLEISTALALSIQVADALDTAHRRGVIHRDIKPANIFVTERDHVKLLDFGLAKRTGPAAMEATTVNLLTEPGSALGTVSYMSPEQTRGQAVDARSDLWSLGVVLYEMSTGVRPFDGPTAPVVFDAIMNRTPQSPRERNSEVPAELERIIRKLLEKEPARRYTSAADLRVDLERLQTGASPVAAGRTFRFSFRYAVASMAVLLMAAGGIWFWQRRSHAKPLTDKDVLVLADFANTTGEPVFDGALREALAIQLEQSPFLKIMDDAQVQQDLRLMNLPPGTRVTSQIAHDICVRDAAAATIGGSISSLGKSYVVTLQAIACQGGATLDREQIQANGQEHVLSALGSAVTAMRARLGESRSSIQKLDLPLERVTTGSLEGLQSYTEGVTELSRGQFLAARPMFERSVALDPNFAMAYFYISVAWGNAGDEVREIEYARKAFTLIDHVSEFEREYIAAGYYESTGELDKAIDAYRQGVANYPRVWGMPNNMSENYITLGEFEEGLKEGLAANQLQPNAEPPYRRLLDAYICLGRLDEAKKVAEQVRREGIDGARIHQRFLEMAYAEEVQGAAAREIQWYAGKPEEYLSFGLQAAHLNVLGQRRESERFYQRAAETALRAGLGNLAAAFEEANAQADALSGKCETVRRLGRPAQALAMCGDAAKAEEVAEESSKLFPNGTIWNTVQLPGIRAAIALNHGQAASAVELLASASPYERAYPEAVYLRGMAYLRLRKGPEAAAEFQKILDHKGASWGSTWRYPNWGLYNSISSLGLARAFELEGDQVKARKAFQDFFALWKDADQDLPILIQAKKDYATLH